MFTKLLGVSEGLIFSMAGVTPGCGQHADQGYRAD
jgi:hypothetical protein